LGCVKELRFFALHFKLFHCVRIYPRPDLSSKDSASVVCCSSMGAPFFTVLFKFAWRAECAFILLLTRKSLSCAGSNLYTREKSFGTIEGELTPFCTPVPVRALFLSESRSLHYGYQFRRRFEGQSRSKCILIQPVQFHFPSHIFHSSIKLLSS
jgi:hypothetical protein